MTMLIATCDIPAEDVTAGRTRIAPDHPLARSHPRAFKPATTGPPDGVRTRDLAEMQERVRQSYERRVIANRMAEIEAEDRERESREKYRRYESASDRERRLFWEQTERVLAQHRPAEEPSSDLYRIDFLLSEEEQAQLEQMDRDWGGERAPWNR
jgi:hypothetical protein